MRREGKKRSDTMNAKLATNNTIHRIRNFKENYLRAKFILPNGMTIEEARHIEMVAKNSVSARYMRQYCLNMLKDHLEKNIKRREDFNGRILYHCDTSRFVSVTGIGSRKEQELLLRVNEALKSPHLIPVVSEDEPAVSLDFQISKNGRLIPHIDILTAEYLANAGFGKGRSWDSLTEDELIHLHKAISRCKELNLDTYYHKTSGPRQSVFETEAAARKSELKERWQQQTRSYKGFGRDWGRKEIDPIEAQGIKMMKGDAWDVLFDAKGVIWAYIHSAELSLAALNKQGSELSSTQYEEKARLESALEKARAALHSTTMTIEQPIEMPLHQKSTVLASAKIDGGIPVLDTFRSETSTRLLSSLGYGPGRTWGSLTIEEIESLRLHTQKAKPFTDVDIHTLGSHRKVFATEDEAVQDEKRVMWRVQTMAWRYKKCYCCRRVSGVPQVDVAKRTVRRLKGRVEDVLWDALEMI
ncbi:hypothetical protein HDU67_008136 [Dinochytrium kinnereticum]|nr:hypothetical protein HDU67_008136 [Dinochytrium kinnereticum]